MNSKKLGKSFADALLSADSQDEINPKSKRVKPKLKKIKDKDKSSNCKTISLLQKSNDISSSSKSVPLKLKDSTKTQSKHSKNNHGDNSKSRNFKASHSKKNCTSKTAVKNKNSDPFSCPLNSSSTMTSSDEEFDAAIVKPITAVNEPNKPLTINEGNKFSANKKAGKAATNKLVAKMLAEEEERQNTTKILRSVDEDLLLFDMKLEGKMFFIFNTNLNISVMIFCQNILFRNYDFTFNLTIAIKCIIFIEYYEQLFLTTDSLGMDLNTANFESQHVPVLPPGIHFLHSLTCHKLHARSV